MARAQGARAQMALAFETVYGTRARQRLHPRCRSPAPRSAPSSRCSNSELLGYGRDPLAPIKDAVTADGDVVVPIDAEAFGFWLKAAFGEPTTTGTGPWTHEFRSGGWTLPSHVDRDRHARGAALSRCTPAACSTSSAGRCSARGC